MDDDIGPLVIDNGSGSIKAGFAGDDAPRSCFDTIVGTPKYQSVMIGASGKKHYVGDDAKTFEGVHTYKYPIEHGIITDWDAMERIWHHTFYNDLRTPPEDHPVLLTEPPLNPIANREHMAQAMFETFNVPAMYVSIPAILAVYGSGRNTAMVLDIGEGVIHTLPITNSFTMTKAISRYDFAGRDLTDYLSMLLQDQGIVLTTSTEREIVRNMKEKFCYAAVDYESELSSLPLHPEVDKKYELPDGNLVTLSKERFQCVEPLFQPTMLNINVDGIHKLLHNAIQNCDIECRKMFYTNMLLSGGSTLIPGLEDRLKQEMSQLVPSNCLLKFVVPPERKYLTWIGGSILASLSTFQSQWVVKAEYDEYGPGILHRKCF